MKIDLTMDWIWGSAGKGGLSGFLALRRPYDAVVCSYGTQAGHSYNNAECGIRMMVQQVPVGVICPTVKNIFIGPGALIHADVLRKELSDYSAFFEGKRLLIHEHAAVVTDDHSKKEYERGQTKMGSTAKGVGQAAIDRILRDPDGKAVAKLAWKGTDLEQYVVDRFTYVDELAKSKHLLVEGAQGFSLSMYHGDYPYCTSRDVTPWQIAADCGLPWDWASNIQVMGVCRTFPIRVNNRDGSSGPAYPGQRELTFEEIGQPVEKTTVTKLPRRVFEFSLEQIEHALFHCGGKNSEVIVSFADYCRTEDELMSIIDRIESLGVPVTHVIYGPDDSDVLDVSGGYLGSKRLAIVNSWKEKRVQPHETDVQKTFGYGNFPLGAGK